MAHPTTDTATTGLENSVRQSWSAGSKVKILSSSSNNWVTAHIVTIHKDWLYCLLDDGDTKKIDRWDASVQPVSTNDVNGEDDEDLFWMKDNTSVTNELGDLPSNQSMSLGFSALSNPNMGNDFSSQNITNESLLSPRTEQNIRTANTRNEQQKMCGYTIWVQWCDSQSLHGYYQCVGLRNNRYHFKHRRDSLAELFADGKGYWYLMYDSKCLYKSKKKGNDDPPPRQWRCIEGSLPPPGVSQVALPDDSTPMVIFEEKKTEDNNGLPMLGNTDSSLGDDESDTMSQVSRVTTVRHLQNNNTSQSHKKGKKSKGKKSKKKKKNKLNLAKLLMDEFDVAIEILDFNFDGSRQVAFHLNIARHMEVTKCKEGGQAETLGVLQGDILLKINDEDISKNWEKATNLLRTLVGAKQKFTITFVRRKVENLVITVVRAGNSEFNGKYKFYKRDKADDMCPIYVKNDHDDDFDFDGIESKEEKEKFDPLNSDSDSVHIIHRVYSNPDNFEALWVLKTGKDEHYYMCVTNEYLPPQHGWELVPDGNATYPAPGLQFANDSARFDHVDRLRPKEESKYENDGSTAAVHDALNINNRNRTNKHRHEKTLTRMRATLGNAGEFNKMGGSNQKRSHTGGASGYMPKKAGMKMGGQKRGGFGQKLFGGKKNKKLANIGKVKHREKDGNESAPETDEDTAKIEAIWKQKLEQTTKNAINQLTTKHAEEIKEKAVTMDNLKESCAKLRGAFQENSEYYYQLYLEKCELSLIVQEKQVEVKRCKDKQKEMGKRYFSQQQRTEELELKLADISSTFSSRMNQIQQKQGRHRPTKSTVNELASIEAQFRNLLHKEQKGSMGKHKSQMIKSKIARSPTKLQQSNSNETGNEYLENEIIKLTSKLSANEERCLLANEENKRLKRENKALVGQLQSKQGGSDKYMAERMQKMSTKVSQFQQNIYNLMSLLQNVEQEYMQKCGKLPRVTKAIDWRNEYDPKKYKPQSSAHSHNQTFVQKQMPKKSSQSNKKSKKSKHKNKNAKGSATESMTLPHDQRWGGFNLGAAADEAGDRVKPKHRNKNESRIIDL